MDTVLTPFLSRKVCLRNTVLQKLPLGSISQKNPNKPPPPPPTPPPKNQTNPKPIKKKKKEKKEKPKVDY